MQKVFESTLKEKFDEQSEKYQQIALEVAKNSNDLRKQIFIEVLMNDLNRFEKLVIKLAKGTPYNDMSAAVEEILQFMQSYVNEPYLKEKMKDELSLLSSKLSLSNNFALLQSRLKSQYNKNGTEGKFDQFIIRLIHSTENIINSVEEEMSYEEIIQIYFYQFKWINDLNLETIPNYPERREFVNSKLAHLKKKLLWITKEAEEVEEDIETKEKEIISNTKEFKQIIEIKLQLDKVLLQVIQQQEIYSKISPQAISRVIDKINEVLPTILDSKDFFKTTSLQEIIESLDKIDQELLQVLKLDYDAFAPHIQVLEGVSKNSPLVDFKQAQQSEGYSFSDDANDLGMPGQESFTPAKDVIDL
jgi:hypothetical protein